MNNLLPDIESASWKELNPTLKVTESTMSMFNYIIIGVVLLALVFGIVNTMLMVILERTKEIGMLTALGLSNVKIALMIVSETIFLCLVGAAIGNLLSFLSISWYGKQGIHFEQFKDGFEQYGMSAEVFPAIDHQMYFTITLLVIFTAIFASIFPIIRAFKLDPAAAIRD